MDLLEWFGVGAGSLLALGALARGVWLVLRRIVFTAEAVKELVPNGGGSIKDTVHRTEQKVDDTAQELSALKQRFDDHLAEHAA
ncbi:hypothetical protein [Streptomyces sp. TRM68416]|uniref:hypothetical protein n=1 Tax=Streptomyces sp. TRM68416 TaxID=2758412 RepID=UPI001661D114|nr:hypothetical protein [Streptomyces sp. TRM68416]MBD0838771.1 hypothetical protein [Streptomyces sp. TRM68416]